MLFKAVKPRYWWKLLHRWIGLTLGTILILVAITGTLLTVLRPLDEWIHADLFKVMPETGFASRPSGAGTSAIDTDVLEQVRQRLRSEFGSQTSLRLRPAQQADDSIRAAVHGSWNGVIFYDPHTATELGRRNDHWTLVNFLFELHSTLLLGEAGKTILAIASLAYLLLLISGLVLWWPIRWHHAWSVKLRAGTTRALFDLHRVGGSLFGILIAISVVSGIYMAWRPLSATVTALSGASVMTAPRLSIAATIQHATMHPASLDLQVSNAHTALPAGQVTLVQLPASPNQPIRVRVKLTDDPHPIGLSSVWLHPVTAKVLAVQRWDQLDPGIRAFAVMYPLHIGDLGGVLHTYLVAILGIALATFGGSGIWLWWRRRVKSKTAS
ncbi:PepSY domain-containing protein [Undibacterium sp. FT31W]|uniref:PepSY domain-containing protein n=2 Tax=Undibacterium griseum TaxID=2762295 RepID=A0ABR6YMV1_9BURK|nr:PepSY domain-containing protein [Undibacterium griseum]